MADKIEPATILLHKPVGFDTISGPKAASDLVQPGTRWSDDPSDMPLLERHFHRLTPLVPLDADASGEIAPYGLLNLNHGLRYNGRALSPCKVSWQNEIRLRFAIKGVQGGQLRDMCAQVGLGVVAIRRIRIGRIPLANMPVGHWRYLSVGQRF